MTSSWTGVNSTNSRFVPHLGFCSTEDVQIHNGATLYVAYLKLTIPCLLMLWWFLEPGHQQARYWFPRPKYSVSSIRRVKVWALIRNHIIQNLDVIIIALYPKLIFELIFIIQGGSSPVNYGFPWLNKTFLACFTAASEPVTLFLQFVPRRSLAQSNKGHHKYFTKKHWECIKYCFRICFQWMASLWTTAIVHFAYDRLISTMGFPILVRRHLYIESGPSNVCFAVGNLSR